MPNLRLLKSTVSLTFIDVSHSLKLNYSNPFQKLAQGQIFKITCLDEGNSASSGPFLFFSSSVFILQGSRRDMWGAKRFMFAEADCKRPSLKRNCGRSPTISSVGNGSITTVQERHFSVFRGAFSFLKAWRILMEAQVSTARLHVALCVCFYGAA